MIRRRMPAVPASAIANAPTPPAAPMPAELQSKPEEVSSEDAAVCTTSGAAPAGPCGGSMGIAKAGLARVAAPRMAAASGAGSCALRSLWWGPPSAIRCADRPARRSRRAHSHPLLTHLAAVAPTTALIYGVARRFASVRYRLLGPLEVSDGRSPCRARGRQAAQRSDAPAVASQRGGVERSADRRAVGRRRPPATAAKVLQNHIAQLRRALDDREGRRLLTRGRGYLLEVADGELDLDRFERLVDEGGGALAGDRPADAAALAARGARAVARAAAGRRRVRGLRAGRDRTAGGAAHRGARAAHRRRSGARPPRRPGSRARGTGRPAPAARTPARAAHGRAVPLRPPGGRPRGLRRRATRAARRAGRRAGPRAARAAGGDPAPGAGAGAGAACLATSHSAGSPPGRARWPPAAPCWPARPWRRRCSPSARAGRKACGSPRTPSRRSISGTHR